MSTMSYNPLVSPYEVAQYEKSTAGPGNQALHANYGIGGHSDLSITHRGSDWYFAVCGIMGFSTLVFMGLSFTKPRADRLFHYITALITLVASIAYFSMGAGLGQTPIVVEFWRPNSPKVHGATHTTATGAVVAGTREIFYVRYIDWFVTTPLLLLDLLLTAGVPWPTIITTIIADEVMVVTGLVGALTRSTYKWGYWTFGMFSMFYVFYSLAVIGRSHARVLGSDVNRVFNACGVLTLFIWLLYPIAWGVSEGGNVIHPDSEAIFYGILDIIAKPVFGFMLIFGHKNITSAQLGLPVTDIAAGPSIVEKNGASNGHSNAHNGVTGTNGTTTTTTAGPATTV